MNIALLDNGISCEGSLSSKIAKVIEIYSDEILNMNNKYFVPVHGTKCAEIISCICGDIQFYDLRILDKNGTTNAETLINALDWCYKNKIRLIHMSLGTLNYFDGKLLKAKINELIRHDVIVVAAYHNINMITYPASFPGVFGVRQDYHGILKKNQFMFQKQQGIQRENSIVAHWCDEEGWNKANSYAAPVITGYIAKFLNVKPSATFRDILQFLERQAICGKTYPDLLDNVVRKEDNIEIPVISGVGLSSEKMIRLTEQFKKNGYQALLLQEHTSYCKAIPIEIYNREDVSLVHILHTVNLIYKPDVILIDLMSTTRWALESAGVDIQIHSESLTYKIYTESYTNITRNFEKIYDIICQYYNLNSS